MTDADQTGFPHVSPALHGLHDADDSDAVAARVLSYLRAGPRPAFVPAPFAAGDTLPRRVPGVNLVPSNLPKDDHPLAIRRNAASIAQNTNGYFQGWRRGHESIRTGGMIPAPARSAALAAPAGPLPAGPLPAGPLPALRSALRRQALRPAAVRLVCLAVRFLPTFERSRYSEEFRAEMSGLTGFQQLGYAIRLALSAPALRRSLRRNPVNREPANDARPVE